MKKYLALIMAIILLLTLGACGKSNTEGTTSETEINSEIIAETDVSEEETSSVASDDEEENLTSKESSTDENGETLTEKATEKSSVPTTDAEILAAYTTVMNKAKTDKAGFTLAEWQELPSDSASRKVSKGTSIVGAALNVANNFMTSEEKAKKNPTTYEKGGDMAAFPIRNTPYGCTLTDTSVLKSVKCEQLSNGNVKITLVLKDELNPEPAPAGSGNSPSNTGKVITPISKAEIDENLNGGVVSAVCKDISYSLLFHDVTSTVVYNPKTNEIVSLKQITKVTVSGKGKIAGMEIVVDKQELINTKEITDLKY